MMQVSPTTDAKALLEQIRNLQAQLEDRQGNLGAPLELEPNKSGFAEAIKSAVNEVNNLQMESKKTAGAYESGVDVSLTELMMKSQKSSIAFEATLQIRNKVLRAYEDIMNMPV
jgi:flagellar hook-basal body complex protein FliE